MKKTAIAILAATVALTAGATTVTDATARIHGLKPGVELKKHAREFPVSDEAPASRASDDISGTYVSGIRQAFTNNDLSEYIGEIAARGNDVTIVADPEVENGYIIKNFCKALFFNSVNPGEVNDIKAVLNTNSGILRINPGQTLFSRDFGEGLGVLDIILMTAGPAADEGEGDEPTPTAEEETGGLGDNVFSPELPIELKYEYGCINLKSPVLGFFALVEDELAPSGVGLVGPNMVVNDMIAWVSNGEMNYYTLPSQQEYVAPVFGLNVNGQCLIYNFAGVDVFNPAPFYRRGNNVMSDDAKLTARVIRDHPAGTGQRTDYYLAEANVNNAYAPIGKDDVRFFIKGEITAEDPTELVIELPTCGLYDESGSYWGIYDDVLISFAPSLLGIDDVKTDHTATDAPAVYYNLQGIRVDNPQGGIFIRRQGTESTKVLIK